MRRARWVVVIDVVGQSMSRREARYKRDQLWRHAMSLLTGSYRLKVRELPARKAKGKRK